MKFLCLGGWLPFYMFDQKNEDTSYIYRYIFEFCLDGDRRFTFKPGRIVIRLFFFSDTLQIHLFCVCIFFTLKFLVLILEKFGQVKFELKKKNSTAISNCGPCCMCCVCVLLTNFNWKIIRVGRKTFNNNMVFAFFFFSISLSLNSQSLHQHQFSAMCISDFECRARRKKNVVENNRRSI